MIRTTVKILPLALALVFTAAQAVAEPTTFHFNRGGLSQAIFQSEATLETITGTSNAVTGELRVDLQSPSSAHGSFAIDASSFRTGIDVRDEHLRGENWIDATRYPEIRFDVTGVEIDGPLTPATPRTATVTGNLSFHGETREVTATARVAYYELPEDTRSNPGLGLTGNALRIEATLPLRLADYGVSIPPVLDLKVAPEITIELRLTGLDSVPDQG
jgi:polyisoprenoid-binding protein YceI